MRHRLWRLDGDQPSELEQAQLLITDGHHRYETALAFHDEDGTEASAWMLAVIVPTEQAGLTSSPPHRVVEHLEEDLDAPPNGMRARPSRRIEAEPRDRSAAVVYRGGGAGIVHGGHGELDSELVERFAPQGVTYTPRLEEAGRCGRRRAGRGRVPAPAADDRAGGVGRPLGRDDAAEEHLLLSEAPHGPSFSSAVTDWLELCRGCAEDVGRVLGELPGRADREGVLGTGGGGDETTIVDDAAEHAVLVRLEALHADGVDFTLVSEELGERVFGGGDLRIVVDPIDGSVNAKRVLPFFSISIAIARGTRVDDVEFGFVHDFGSGEEVVGLARRRGLAERRADRQPAAA